MTQIFISNLSIFLARLFRIKFQNFGSNDILYTSNIWPETGVRYMYARHKTITKSIDSQMWSVVQRFLNFSVQQDIHNYLYILKTLTLTYYDIHTICKFSE